MVGELFGIHFLRNENREGIRGKEMETETKRDVMFLDSLMESKNTSLKLVSDFH